MRLALYQPDIPQNAGSLIRLGACLGVPVDLIEPCGFLLTDRNFRRAGMDYLARAALTRHESWARFQETRLGTGARLVLLDLPGTGALHDRRSPMRVPEMVEACRAQLQERGVHGPVHLLAMSLVVLVYAYWPSNKKPFEHAAQAILQDDDKPYRG